MPYEINDRALSWAPPESIEPEAIAQIEQTSQMPFIHRYVAVMPDCHFGLGATVGSCIPTVRSNHSCRCWCGHRLRHDGGADELYQG